MVSSWLWLQFANLCGTVHKGGNILFTPDGNAVLSAVGNRVTVFDLVKCANSPHHTLHHHTLHHHTLHHLTLHHHTLHHTFPL
jgi:hypothetical protein